MTGWLPPMLATPTDRRFSDADWVFERKLDGRARRVHARGRRAAAVVARAPPARRRVPRSWWTRWTRWVGPGSSPTARSSRSTGGPRVTPGCARGCAATPARRGWPCTTACSTCSPSTARWSPTGRCDSEKRLLRNVFRYLDPLRFNEHHAPARRGVLPARARPGLGRAGRQAGGLALPAGPLGGLADVRLRAPAALRGRRLHRATGCAGGVRRAARGVPRRASGSATPARSAPATTARCCARLRDRLEAIRGRSARSPTTSPRRPRTGSGRSW